MNHVPSPESQEHPKPEAPKPAPSSDAQPTDAESIFFFDGGSGFEADDWKVYK